MDGSRAGSSFARRRLTQAALSIIVGAAVVAALVLMSPRSPNTIQATGTQSIPVVFIPGHMATTLIATTKINHPEGGTFNAGEQVWGATAFFSQEYYYPLELTYVQGNPPTNPVEVLGRNAQTGERDLTVNPLVLTVTASVGVGSEAIHQPTMDTFAAGGFQFGKSLFVYGWDWRKGAGSKYGGPADAHGNYVNVKELDQMIDKINVTLQRPAGSKVHIVAHSHGGYVAWLYLSKHADKVQTLTTLGTPYLGAAKLAAALTWGVKYSSWGYGPEAATIKRIGRTFPGAAELLPRPKAYVPYFFDLAGELDPNKKRYIGTAEVPKLLRAKIAAEGGDPTIIDHAKTFQAELAAALQGGTRGVPVRVIIGTGLETYEKLHTKPGTVYGTHKTYSSEGGGDGTVPVFSGGGAPLLPNGVQFSYIKDNGTHDQEHLKLTHNSLAMKIVLNIVKGLNYDAGLTLPERSRIAGIPTFPLAKKLTGKVESPLNLHAYDGSGNHTGLDASSFSEENIPGSQYDLIGESGGQTISLLPDQSYELHLDSYAPSQADFNFALTSTDDNGTITQMILYLAVPISLTTNGLITWDGSTIPPLQLDQDGDGVYEEQLMPTMAGSSDADSDGLIDGVEVFYYLTDPQIPDSDGDGLSDGAEVNAHVTDPLSLDTDQDGCADSEELGFTQNLGGRRDPINFWDFFSVPTGPSLIRDKAVAIGDIIAVVARFGSSGDPDIDPLSPPPPPPAYHTAYDRTDDPDSTEAWDLLDPNGSITIEDIIRVVQSFGHSCVAAP